MDTTLLTVLPAINHALDYGSLMLRVQTPFEDYTGIENVHSQQFSVIIFAFMLLGILLFASIAFAFMAGRKKTLRRGEKWLFAWIFLGIVVSIAFGALQLLGGYLI
jgi:cadmium resistance protein CadD (predicted permease)